MTINFLGLEARGRTKKCNSHKVPGAMIILPIPFRAKFINLDVIFSINLQRWPSIYVFCTKYGTSCRYCCFHSLVFNQTLQQTVQLPTLSRFPTPRPWTTLSSSPSPTSSPQWYSSAWFTISPRYKKFGLSLFLRLGTLQVDI